MNHAMKFEDLLGLTFALINGGVGSDELKFVTNDARIFRQYHEQNCCESVYIDEIHGDLDDLIGSPILLAEEAVYDNKLNPDGKEGCDDYRWTFYKLATVKGHVTIKWLGESNGYYSTDVSFFEVRE